MTSGEARTTGEKMNLLSLLMKSMVNQAGVSAVASASGASGKQSKSLMTLALPILLKYLTKNASSAGGAASLLSALTQHKDQSSMVQQLGAADKEDGGKILAHILGGDQAAVVSQLAGQTGMNQSQVTQALSSMTPALMSGLSAATTETAGGNGIDGLAQMFGASQSSGGIMGMLGGLFGGKKPQAQTNAGNDGTELLSLLGALMK